MCETLVLRGTLTGHTGDVTAIAFPIIKSNLIVTSSRDNTIIVWNILQKKEGKIEGKVKHCLADHTDHVEDVVLSYDAEVALSGSRDRELRMWDINQGTCIRRFVGHSDHVLSVSFTDRRFIASASRDCSIKIWNVNGECKHTIEGVGGHSGCVNSVKFLPFSPQPMFVSTSKDSFVKVWNLASRKLKSTLAGHIGDVKTVALSVTSPLCATGGVDGSVFLWDLSEVQKKVYDFEVNSMIYSMCFSPHIDRKMLCIATESSIKIWDYESKMFLADLLPELDDRIAPLNVRNAVSSSSSSRMNNVVKLNMDSEKSNVVESCTNATKASILSIPKVIPTNHHLTRSQTKAEKPKTSDSIPKKKRTKAVYYNKGDLLGELNMKSEAYIMKENVLESCTNAADLELFNDSTSNSVVDLHSEGKVTKVGKPSNIFDSKAVGPNAYSGSNASNKENNQTNPNHFSVDLHSQRKLFSKISPRQTRSRTKARKTKTSVSKSNKSKTDVVGSKADSGSNVTISTVELNNESVKPIPLDMDFDLQPKRKETLSIESLVDSASKPNTNGKNLVDFEADCDSEKVSTESQLKMPANLDSVGISKAEVACKSNSPFKTYRRRVRKVKVVLPGAQKDERNVASLKEGEASVDISAAMKEDVDIKGISKAKVACKTNSPFKTFFRRSVRKVKVVLPSAQKDQGNAASLKEGEASVDISATMKEDVDIKIIHCTSICWNLEGTLLFSGYSDGAVRIWGYG